MKKKALFYLVVGVVVFILTSNWLSGSFEPNTGNKGETERLELYREYEEETNPTLTWHSISNNSELVEYEENVKKWLEEKGE
jgi:hypothetical protein